jgi:hypothetical protein
VSFLLISFKFDTWLEIFEIFEMFEIFEIFEMFEMFEMFEGEKNKNVPTQIHLTLSTPIITLVLV